MLSPESVYIDSLARDTVISDFRTRNFNDVKVGLNLAGPTTGIWDWVIDGTYYLP